MEEVEALYHGVLLGFVLFVSAGPIFFAVIETSIRKGFRYALSISIGTFFSDVLYISLAYFGLQPLFQNDSFKTWLGIIGGIVLIVFGIIQLLKKVDLHAKDLHLQKKSSYTAYALKGFVINTFNPFVFFFWLAVIGGVTVNYEDSNTSQLMFFAGVLGTIFLTDMLKAFIAGKIKHLLNPTVFHWVNRIVGLVMIYFGLRMMWKVAITF
jgi:threonine/homoserine/homoserine lactone efflux protein